MTSSEMTTVNDPRVPRGPSRRGASQTSTAQSRRGGAISLIGTLSLVVLLPAIAESNRLYAQQTIPSAAPGGAEKSDTEEPQSDEPQPNVADGKDEERKQARLADMELPTVAQLLHERPITWVVLKRDEEVLVTEPVTPRPHTLQVMQERIDESYKWPRPRTPKETEEQRDKRAELHFVYLVVPGDAEQPEYKLEMKHIQEVIHHEDLMLRRADTLLDEGKLREAFELLLVLQRRHPNWPGYEARHNRLLLLEAEHKAEQGEWEDALVYLEDLHGRDSQHSGLSRLLGKVIDRLIVAAVIDDDFRRARHFLSRLSRLEPRHRIVGAWTSGLQARAEDEVAAAMRAFEAGEYDRALDLADQAARTWPALPNLRTTYLRIANRFQRLAVGVVSLPGEPSAYTLPTDADWRHKHLTQIGLYEVGGVDQTAHYRTRFFDEWEPTELGRRMIFTIRQRRSDWEVLPSVTATPIVATLASRLDPSSVVFDERLAGFVESITLQSPFQFTIDFVRAPLRVEGLLTGPLLEVNGATSDSLGDVGPRRDDLLLHEASRRFAVYEQDVENQAAGTITYRRSTPQPDGALQYYLAEMTERRYESHEKAVQGLLRGEVSMLPHVHPKDAARLQEDERFFVRSYALPVTHVLQFNPGSPSMRSNELRRALAYAVDRRAVLDKTVLQGADAKFGRLTSAPYPQKNAAYNSLLPQRKHEVFLAASLAAAARKQLGGEIPTLYMPCPPDPIARAAARRLIADWARIGVTVELQTQRADLPADDAPHSWDLVYRTVRMAEPLVELWPFLTMETEAQIESLRHLPDWLRRELIELDNAGNWSTALNLLHRLHEQLEADMQLIPLWELDDFLVVRRTVSGMPEQPLHPYQNVERWITRPWYPTETP
jgi:tetratricopeptide (TPR) repeat protein